MGFDEDIPQHRRMTVTRVTDHAELADSVLSAQSAPTINISPMSPPCPPEVTRSIIIESHQLPLKRENGVDVKLSHSSCSRLTVFGYQTFLWVDFRWCLFEKS